MRITQLRNATIIVELGAYRILVDPMLAGAGALPALRLFDGKRLRNPLVALPANAGHELAQVTHCLITHCQKGHFDHLDRAGKAWLRGRAVPVLCSARDAAYLRRRGLDVQPLEDLGEAAQPFLGGSIRMLACTHGRGLVGSLMEHGVGYLIELPGEPSLYLMGDTLLTDSVRGAIARYQPQVVVAPAGGARFDLGGEIIMGLDEIVELAGLCQGSVVANHLEALSHCPVSRAQLRHAAPRVLVPDDGQCLSFGLATPARQRPAG